jgi:hypothetical protein
MRRLVGIAVVPLVLIAISLAQQPARTAAPNFIRHIGTLKDAQGTASNQSTTISVNHALYKQESGIATTTTLGVSSNNVPAGTPVVFTATVMDQNSAPVTVGQGNGSTGEIQSVPSFPQAIWSLRLTRSGGRTLFCRR